MKFRLVSYSSQDSTSQDESGSRKRTRKHTAVSRMETVLIDSITRDEREAEPPDNQRGSDNT